MITAHPSPKTGMASSTSVAPRDGRIIGSANQGAIGAIFRSGDKGATWEKIVDDLKGGIMHMCPTPDGNGMVAGTSDGSLLIIDESGCREVASGLPFVTAVELAA
jgi:photosystem II stability/assembly factor-like uncharacterized protein